MVDVQSVAGSGQSQPDLPIHQQSFDSDPQHVLGYLRSGVEEVALEVSFQNRIFQGLEQSGVPVRQGVSGFENVQHVQNGGAGQIEQGDQRIFQHSPHSQGHFVEGFLEGLHIVLHHGVDLHLPSVPLLWQGNGEKIQGGRIWVFEVQQYDFLAVLPFVAELQNFEMQNVIDELAVRFDHGQTVSSKDVAVDQVEDQEGLARSGSGQYVAVFFSGQGEDEVHQPTPETAEEGKGQEDLDQSGHDQFGLEDEERDQQAAEPENQAGNVQNCKKREREGFEGETEDFFQRKKSRRI